MKKIYLQLLQIKLEQKISPSRIVSMKKKEANYLVIILRKNPILI